MGFWLKVGGVYGVSVSWKKIVRNLTVMHKAIVSVARAIKFEVESESIIYTANFECPKRSWAITKILVI